jgi:nitrate/nitrite-specific signal transduction histidine kinase
VEFQLLQIAREALANAAKHASTTGVWVELEHGPGHATLRVRDNGLGFSSSQPQGHGLNIMNERASIIGASLAVSSAPGQGTEVVVVYPYTGKEVAPTPVGDGVAP